jgi:dTDP-4-dehydrorhamnose reductase
MGVKRILVTGANGQLGKSLRDSSKSFPEMDFLFLGRSDMDITKATEIREWFLKFRPDYCVNCAAYTQVDQAEKNPLEAYNVNVKGVENLAVASREFGSTLIHISTDYVFDGKKKEGYLPTDKPNPINVYGKTKMEGERAIQERMKKYFIIRTSWLYSKSYGPNFYLTILNKAKQGEDLSVTDSQRGCPTNAANLAHHILEKIQSETEDYGISHFTDGVPMSWFEFAGWILQQEGLSPYKNLQKAENYRTFAVRPSNSILLH